jgi:hypothetical protein
VGARDQQQRARRRAQGPDHAGAWENEPFQPCVQGFKRAGWRSEFIYTVRSHEDA